MQTFSRLALEIVDMDPLLLEMNTIGVDLEEAISKGFQRIFPDVKTLYCVRHLKQRDEQKLSHLTAGLNVSAASKVLSRTEILKDIYGERKGTWYEYGLAESSNEDDFIRKLNGLEQKWEAHCPGFYRWFCDQRVDRFINSVICSARDGTNVSGLYYQNDIEALHFVEKKNQQFRKESIVNVIEGLRDLVHQQRIEEIRAIYGAGRYEIAQTHKNFTVDSAKWHSWSETRRINHVEAFRSFQPGFSDQYRKPEGAGRKPCYQKKVKSSTPEIIQDRLRKEDMLQQLEQNQSTQPIGSHKLQSTCSTSHQPDQSISSQLGELLDITTTESTSNHPPPQIAELPQSSNTLGTQSTISQLTQSINTNVSQSARNIRFSDPRKPAEKLFQLYHRKNLSRAIRKCQGNCGKRITPEDPVWLVKTYGQTKWTDKKTGKEMSKYGAMYVHFNAQCLESFDTEIIYGIARKFDFSRITIDKENQQKLNVDERILLEDLQVRFL